MKWLRLRLSIERSDVRGPPWSVLVAWGWGNITQPRKITKKKLHIVLKQRAQQRFAVMSCTALVLVLSPVDKWFLRRKIVFSIMGLVQDGRRSVQKKLKKIPLSKFPKKGSQDNALKTEPLTRESEKTCVITLASVKTSASKQWLTSLSPPFLFRIASNPIVKSIIKMRR